MQSTASRRRAPALGHEGLLVPRFELELQDACDALVIFEVSNMNASVEIEKLRLETHRHRGNRLANVRSGNHRSTSPQDR